MSLSKDNSVMNNDSTANNDLLLDDVIASLLDGTDDNVSNMEESSVGEAPPQTTGKDVELTSRAVKQMLLIKEREALGDDVFLRIAVEGGGCSGMSYKLGFDHKTEDDSIITAHGIEVLVDIKHLLYLKGIVIDYPDGLDARGFTFDNPNASETCGCGTSFSA
jgi:iron-sulfur cluster assembly protein